MLRTYSTRFSFMKLASQCDLVYLLCYYCVHYFVSFIFIYNIIFFIIFHIFYVLNFFMLVISNSYAVCNHISSPVTVLEMLAMIPGRNCDYRQCLAVYVRIII